MLTIVNPPGRPGLHKPVTVRSIAVAMRTVKRGRVATAAGHLGALNVYRGENRILYGQRMVYGRTVSETRCKTLDGLRAWLCVNIRLLGDFNQVAALR